MSNVSIPSATSATAPSTTLRRAWQAGLTSTAVAAATNLGVLAVARLAGADMVVQPQSTDQAITVGAGSVVVMTVVPLLLATLLLLPLRRWGPAAWRALALGGLVIGVATVVMPFTVSAAAGTASGLALMHVVAGVVWFVAVRRAARPVVL